MPPFFLIPGLIQAGLGLGQLIGGLSTRVKRPLYEIPQETTEGLDLARQNLNARSAAASYQQENIFQNQANTIANAQQAGGGFFAQQAMAAQAQANSNRAFEQLSAGEREDYQRRLAQLSQAQGRMADARNTEFEINELQPFQDKAATRSALMEGGIQNIFNSTPLFMRGMDGANGMYGLGRARTPSYGYLGSGMPTFDQPYMPLGTKPR